MQAVDIKKEIMRRNFIDRSKIRVFVAMICLLLLFFIFFAGYGLLLQVLWKTIDHKMYYINKPIGFGLSILFGSVCIYAFNRYNNSVIAPLINRQSALLFKMMFTIAINIIFFLVWFTD